VSGGATVERGAAAWHRQPVNQDEPMLQRLYRWLLALSAGPYAPAALAVVAVADASCFPCPPEVLLIPMAMARPERAWHFAAIATVASICGGALGYLIGYTLFDVVAVPLLHAYHGEAAYERFRQLYAEWGIWVILIKGMTPIPYLIVTLASGALRYSFPVFIAASIVTRGARFFLVATLLHYFGDTVRVFVERHLTLVTSLVAVGIVVALVLVRFL
jgi:membrane protein YqaA with SNARE-associated domain